MKIIYEIGHIIGPKGLIYLGDIEPHTLPSGQSKRKAIFQCTCGKKFEAYIHSVKRGTTSNCGCGAKSNRQKHGMTGSKTRMCWGHIKNRCYKKSSKNYKFYGARGITMYGPWIHNFRAFNEYVSTLEGYEVKGLTIDRIKNHEGYFPGNLRWTDMKTQANNRRPRSSRNP